MNDCSQTYESKFQDEHSGTEYDKLYQGNTCDETAWHLERALLVDILRRYNATGPSRSYLDFACGTGRVVSFLEGNFGVSRGIDTSTEMLRLASQKVHHTNLTCANILKSNFSDDKYDVITAFRFFLNANVALRFAVMKQLGKMLQNNSSLLIFTNHGNPISYKAVLWPYHQLRRVGKRRPVVGNYMTHSQVARLVNKASLKIVERHGYGFVSGRLYSAIPALADKLEAAAHRWTRLSKLGVNQLYVVRKK